MKSVRIVSRKMHLCTVNQIKMRWVHLLFRFWATRSRKKTSSSVCHMSAVVHCNEFYSARIIIVLLIHKTPSKNGSKGNGTKNIPLEDAHNAIFRIAIVARFLSFLMKCVLLPVDMCADLIWNRLKFFSLAIERFVCVSLAQAVCVARCLKEIFKFLWSWSASMPPTLRTRVSSQK